jgi:hypothetical protein
MAPGIVEQALREAQEAHKGRPGGVILWRGEGVGQNPKGLYFDKEELTRDVIASIGRGLRTIKENLFVSRQAVAEHKLDSKVDRHYLAGRADFTMIRPKHKDTIIIDGKGTTHTLVGKDTGIRKGKYLHDDQLVWYSLLYREHYGRLPDQAAFLFWKYEPPTNVTWVEINETVVDTLKHKVLSLADSLLEKRTALYGLSLTEVHLAKGLPAPRVSLTLAQEYFTPKANQKNCQFCPFATEDLCPAGHEVMLPIRERWANREV